MANIKNQTDDSGPTRPGLGSELNQVRSNGAATAAELREFIGTLKGKSPQEVLGVVAQSSLTRSIVQATIGFVIVLVVFSILPYGYNKMWPSEASAATANTTAETETPEENAKTNQTANADPSAAAVADSSSAAGDLPDKLGIGETKTSDPKSNPLDSDNKLDKLLDGVD